MLTFHEEASRGKMSQNTPGDGKAIMKTKVRTLTRDWRSSGLQKGFRKTQFNSALCVILFAPAPLWAIVPVKNMTGEMVPWIVQNNWIWIPYSLSDRFHTGHVIPGLVKMPRAKSSGLRQVAWFESWLWHLLGGVPWAGATHWVPLCLSVTFGS